MKYRVEVIQGNTECFAVYVEELQMYAQFASLKDAALFAVEVAKLLQGVTI